MNGLPICPRCGKTVSYEHRKLMNRVIPSIGKNYPTEIYSDTIACYDCGTMLESKTEVTMDVPDKIKERMFEITKKSLIEKWDEICKLKESLEE